MHWRPDAVTKTGVIQPMWVRQVSPVDMATHTIDPFIASVRGPGPAVNPYPSPEDVAYAAGAVAKQFRAGKRAVVGIGTDKVTVDIDTQCGGIVGTIVAAARELMKGGAVSIEIGGRRLVVQSSNDGTPVVQAAAPYPTPTSNPNITATATPPAAGFGRANFGKPALYNNGVTVLPNAPRPGNVPQGAIDYGNYYRELNYNPNAWARRTFQARISQQWAPNAIRAMNQANRVAIEWADTVVQPALNSREPMSAGRRPEPQAVYPQNAAMTWTPQPGSFSIPGNGFGRAQRVRKGRR
jgi:hypothetical protein